MRIARQLEHVRTHPAEYTARLRLSWVIDEAARHEEEKRREVVVPIPVDLIDSPVAIANIVQFEYDMAMRSSFPQRAAIAKSPQSKPYELVELNTEQSETDPITFEPIKKPIKMKCCSKIMDLSTFEKLQNKDRCVLCIRDITNIK